MHGAEAVPFSGCQTTGWPRPGKKRKEEKKKIIELPKNQNEKEIDMNTHVKKWSMCVIFIMNTPKSRASSVRLFAGALAGERCLMNIQRQAEGQAAT